MSLAADLEARSEDLATGLPALLAEAERLAAWVHLGEHGRRRAGTGDEFWQYRAGQPGDSLRMVDWRRSAQSEAMTYIREREWQVSQSLSFWVDGARSMVFSGAPDRPAKAARARLLAMAAAILALKAGERVGLAGLPPRAGKAQKLQIAQGLLADLPADYGDYSAPGLPGLPTHGRIVLLSDFLGPLEALEPAMVAAADRGIRGVLLQVLDPEEEAFPFRGRVLFQSMGGSLAHETQSADALRPRYLDRLAERKARLADLGRALGWPFHCHHTGHGAAPALFWLHGAIGGGKA